MVVNVRFEGTPTATLRVLIPVWLTRFTTASFSFLWSAGESLAAVYGPGRDGQEFDHFCGAFGAVLRLDADRCACLFGADKLFRVLGNGSR